MKFMKWGKDGGPESGVYGFWLVEIKSLFSVVFLRFDQDDRKTYHSHAFNAITWWLSGEVEEQHRDGKSVRWRPSFLPKYTPRSCFHKVIPIKRTYAISIRGPWSKRWFEYRKDTQTLTTLEHGRKVVGVERANSRSGLFQRPVFLDREAVRHKDRLTATVSRNHNTSLTTYN